jgi:hypothetical protein
VHYYLLDPEVAGGLGHNTELDATCHPPKVEHLHYAFDGWLGDCLVESFPCFIATESVIADLKAAGITGFEDDDVEVSTSEEFDELYPNREIGRWRWLRLVGVPGEDDIAATQSTRMVASERALEILKLHGLKHCAQDEYRGEQTMDVNRP